MFTQLAGWVRCSGGRLTYKGRITRAPFEAWARTQEGQAAIVDVARHIRFALFGKERAARRRLWRALALASHDESVIATLQAEVKAYLGRLNHLAYADGLPRDGVKLRRIVVVPRIMLNGAAYRSLATAFRMQPALTGIEADEALREFLTVRLLREMHAAIVRALPSPRRPLWAGHSWLSVGVNSAFVWREPISGPRWPGHHYLLELTREPITRAVRKEVVVRIQRFEAGLPRLSVNQRDDILRRATNVA